MTGLLTADRNPLPMPDSVAEPQVLALAALLADPGVDEGIKARVRSQVAGIVAHARERAARESEGER